MKGLVGCGAESSFAVLTGGTLESDWSFTVRLQDGRRQKRRGSAPPGLSDLICGR